MCKYNFNPKPNNVHECWEECECNSCTEKRGEVERLSGCTSVKGSTMAVYHSIQPDKTPPASKKITHIELTVEAINELISKTYEGGKSEGRKDVLIEVQNIITAMILPLDLIVMRTTHTEASHRIAKYQVGILKRLSRELKASDNSGYAKESGDKIESEV